MLTKEQKKIIEDLYYETVVNAIHEDVISLAINDDNEDDVDYFDQIRDEAFDYLKDLMV